MKKSLVFTIIIIILSSSLFAREQKDVLQKRPVGTEFWLCFMKNFLQQKTSSSTNTINLELFITGDVDAEVIIEIEKLGFKKTIDFKGNTVNNVKLDPRAEINDFGKIVDGLAIHITSDNPISVYGLNTRFQTTDNFLGLPVNVLGTDYRVMSYHVAGELNSVFAVVATEDSTVVRVVPTVETMEGHKAGEPFEIRLNKGEIYQCGSKIDGNKSLADLTGTRISSNKKISVFSGHQCAYVPAGFPRVIACNHLVEQLPPVSSWGKHFYVGKLEKRSEYTFRVLAHENDTKVFIDGDLIAVLNEGEFYEADDDNNLQITADKPVLVAQYSQGYKNGDLIGDPMMLLISPTQQFLDKYRFATPINGSWNHYINIVVPSNNIDSLYLDGRKISPEKFTQLGLSRYSIAYIEIDYGTHFIECTAPFGLYSYGFGYGEDAYDAYGTMGGQSFLEYVGYTDELPPLADISTEQSIIFRDDRVDDSGISSIKILSSENIDSEIPDFTEATPYVKVNLLSDNPNQDGRIVYEVKDLFGNTSHYTVCYKFDKFNKNRIYTISSGRDVSCYKKYKYAFGAFVKFSNYYHKTDFSNTGQIITKGVFSNASGTGGLFGFSLSRMFNGKFTASLNVSVDNYGGTLTAPDSTLAKIRDTQTGELRDFQEANEIELKSTYLHSMIIGEYNFNNYFYGFAGFNTSILLSDAIEYRKRIVIPSGFVYDTGESSKSLPPENLSSFRNFRLGLIIGGGFKLPITDRVFVFSNVFDTYHLNDIIDDGNWKLNQLSVTFGVKYLF